MRYLELGGHDRLPVLGQGTWHMGERERERTAEVSALRHGLDLGLGLIDTAEMYGDGGAEAVVGEAIAGRRDEVFLVSKVLPHNASENGTITACERSLSRLRTGHIDLYLLHWPGRIPLGETLSAFVRLREEGKIRHFGVSNFDTGDMSRLWSAPHGPESAVNQVLYNLTRRGPEFELLPWCGREGVPVMAYSPIEQGRLLADPVLREVALRHEASPAQIAIAWVLSRRGVCAIPKAATAAHVGQNAAALGIELSARDIAELDDRFPAPRRATPLEIL
ncbi:oxidoreductase [Prauserella marina]|uniref:Aldo/keto reductase n=1 Tax=Prauserella marina TaxID=530584 RepID=A0A222VQP3_9PSEU|nr:aldo/keto reductase [Prauserella marina]ASR36053.1 oxidoreductase [Prauserella marina]PWV83989.1 diketogulonate reductase-like aldo/keto reductase [Prauserella marina]SDC33028.1 Aldo/keto reductase [Prauserella marina]